MIPNAPPQLITGIIHRLFGLGHVENQHAQTLGSAKVVFHNIGGDLYRLINTLAQPFSIELGAQYRSMAVFNA